MSGAADDTAGASQKLRPLSTGWGSKVTEREQVEHSLQPAACTEGRHHPEQVRQVSRRMKVSEQLMAASQINSDLCVTCDKLVVSPSHSSEPQRSNASSCRKRQLRVQIITTEEELACSRTTWSLEGLKVCGSSLPPPFISTQDQVWIHFISNRDSDTGKGFRLSYVTGSLSAPGCDVTSSTALMGSASLTGGAVTRWMNVETTQTRSCVSTPPLLHPLRPAPVPLPVQDLGDEIDCEVPSCGERLRNFYGSFSSPNYPDFYPPGSNCSWTIDTGDPRKRTLTYPLTHPSPPQVVLRFTDFKLDGTGYGDYVKVYDGLEENPRRLLRVLTAFDSRAPVAVVSSSGQLRIHFYADKINAARGFNATYQVDGFCLPWEVPCGGNWGCYTEQQRCDGYWHCPNGRDELNCSSCQEDEFPCSRNGACYPRSDRCNYQNRCPNGSDEKNCFFCQPGNFHCKNNRCVFESWVCDAQDDCGDGSDEESCPVIVPTRVITAAVIGSLICGLLLVIALGCTCKLYSLRMFERRVEAELLRREAPPSYGQLIAQGLIPPVEDFPVCSGNQVLISAYDVRLTVLSVSGVGSGEPAAGCRSQLGFTSLRLPSSGRHSNLWRRLFTFPRSRRSGSLALVSADLEDGGSSNSSDLLSPDSDPETEGERGGAREGERGGGREGGGGRERGAAGGPVAPSLRRPRHQLVWRPWFPHPDAGLCPDPGGPAPFQPRRHGNLRVTAPPRPRPPPPCSDWPRPEPPRPPSEDRPAGLDQSQPSAPAGDRKGGAQAGEQRNREEEEDVELLIPVSDSDSASSSSLE
ncbi:hypothetical protein F7725_024607 [Dissostichus mawsoni]|uniref:CUB domain-containing protein n=1 Tax=Dissostichus mawsoni TaxID=36200 RepID=A0A7J5X9B4_DISMA|nr:hypothetical protein F7725_024607 [Dissostichus mawsoni]